MIFQFSIEKVINFYIIPFRTLSVQSLVSYVQNKTEPETMHIFNLLRVYTRSLQFISHSNGPSAKKIVTPQNARSQRSEHRHCTKN